MQFVLKWMPANRIKFLKISGGSISKSQNTFRKLEHSIKVQPLCVQVLLAKALKPVSVEAFLCWSIFKRIQCHFMKILLSVFSKESRIYLKKKKNESITLSWVSWVAGLMLQKFWILQKSEYFFVAVIFYLYCRCVHKLLSSTIHFFVWFKCSQKNRVVKCL